MASKTCLDSGEAGGEEEGSVLLIGDEVAEPLLFRLDPLDEVEFFLEEVPFDGLALEGVGEEDPLEEAPPLASGSPLDRLRLLVAAEALPFRVGKPRPIGMLKSNHNT